METIRLQQMLNTFQPLDVLGYSVICSFLNSPTPKHLLALTNTLDEAISQHSELNDEQASCMQYLFRDWGYNHIKHAISKDDIKTLFSIDGKQHASGHFFAAIDFAKRTPKDNSLLMNFSLSLLLQSSLPIAETQPKIEAIEQLLSNTDTHSIHYLERLKPQKILFLGLFNTLLILYSIKQVIQLKLPLS